MFLMLMSSLKILASSSSLTLSGTLSSLTVKEGLLNNPEYWKSLYGNSNSPVDNSLPGFRSNSGSKT